MSMEVGENELRQFLAGLDGDRNLIQGAGGNVSVKHGDQMLIKASGFSMAQAFHPELFCRVSIDENGRTFRSSGSVESASRPSIETPVHAALPHKFVAHFHAVSVMPWLVCRDAKEHSPVRLSDSIKLVDYAKPGQALAREIQGCVNQKSHSSVTIYLQNHGIVIAAESIDEVKTELSRVPKSDICRDLESGETVGEDDFFDQAAAIFENVPIVSDEEINLLTRSWAICPDHVVFLGAQLLQNIDINATLDAQGSTPSKPIKIFWSDAKGFLVNRNLTLPERDQIQFYFDVIARVEDFSEIVALNSLQVNELLSWEAEHFRQQQNKTQT